MSFNISTNCYGYLTFKEGNLSDFKSFFEYVILLKLVIRFFYWNDSDNILIAVISLLSKSFIEMHFYL